MPAEGNGGTDARAEKVFAAERSLAKLRLAVIATGTVLFPLTDAEGAIRPLAYALLAGAWVYGAYVYLAEPYRRSAVLRSSAFTTVTDAAFTMVWLFATGGFDSPFYVALYVAVLAVAWRYSARETVAAAALYGLGYLGLVAAVGETAGHEAELAVRVTYVGLAAALGSLFSQTALSETRARIRLADVAFELEAEVRHRVGVEHALRDQNRLYETLVREQSDLGEGVVITEGERIVFANDALGRLYGYTVPELLAMRSYLELVHPDDRVALVARLRRRLSGAEPFG
ncbi:MAG: PAS domain-containing protein, partial [Methanobacteriota archaeon]